MEELGKRYGLIVADPPWDAATYSDKGKSRHAPRHYSTLPTDAIAAIVPRRSRPTRCWVSG
jgi:hypothetical protein